MLEQMGWFSAHLRNRTVMNHPIRRASPANCPIGCWPDSDWNDMAELGFKLPCPRRAPTPGGAPQ
jgi:hypothetical protein